MAMTPPYDVIVIGAGAAGLTAASVAASLGYSVLLLEHADVVGGTSAISGGMVWIPANAKMAALGIDDDLEQARKYLSPLVRETMPERLSAFLERSNEALTFLETHTSLRLQPVHPYPDYYPDLEGSQPGARVLEPAPFDGRILGDAFAKVRPPLQEFMLFGGMMVSRQDIPAFRRFGRSAKPTLRVLGLVAKYLKQRLSSPRGTTLYLGNALVAHLFKSVLDLGVELQTGVTVSELLCENGRVCGVRASVGGKQFDFRSAGGVIMATGGISHDADLRRPYVSEAVAMRTATVDRNGAPCGARLGLPLRAKMSDPAHGSGFWVPISEFSYSDGRSGYFPHTVTDRGKPGMIAVADDGKRFVNEAVSYHEFGLAQIQKGETAIPAHLICDADFIWKYGIGRIRPFAVSLKRDIASGYLRKADSIADLAAQIGVPKAALCNTVSRFNRDATDGRDMEYGRGENIYQRHLGDSDVRPNPCVAPIKKAPFYSVAVRPGDLGMSAGLVTTKNAEVLDQDGEVINGLFACGNDMQSVMNGAYPGPGITLGPALTFGYVAATRAIERLPGRM